MRNRIIQLMCVGVGLLFFAQAAWGAGLNVTTWSDGIGDTYKVFDKDGKALEVGSYVQVVKGSISPPNKIKANFLNSGDQYFEGKVGGQNTGVVSVDNQRGEFDFTFNDDIDPQAGDAFVRVWNATSPKEGAYYNHQKEYMLGPGMRPADLKASFSTVYKAAKPLAPKSNADGFSLAYDPTVGYLPSFNISAVDVADKDGKTKYEIVGYNIRIRKKGAPDWILYPGKSSVKIEEKNPKDPYYLADGITEYEVQSQAYNYFGGDTESDWGEVYPFRIPLSGGTASFNFTLNPSSAEKLFVNSIASPKATTALAIKTVINTKAGKPVVAAIYKWDKTTGQPLGAIFDTTNDSLVQGTADFNLDPGEGVQVYTIEEVNIVL